MKSTNHNISAVVADNLPIGAQHKPFLVKVMLAAELQNLYDAKEVTEVVYRTMRDLMDVETIDRVASEVGKPAIESGNKSLDANIADLWQDTNPLVSFLSRLRPAFSQEAPLGIDDNLFLRRVEQEGALPTNVAPLTVIKAVFEATKAELTPEVQAEVANALPGIIKTTWENA